MASIVILKNPLAPHTREVVPVPDNTAVIDWLQEHYPDGFGMPVRFYVNGEEKPLDDLDYKVAHDDVAIVAAMPGAFLALSPMMLGLLLAAALAVVTFFVMRAFMPKEKKNKEDELGIYDINADQNAARLGECVPVVYGSPMWSPDYVSQPYRWFNWSQRASYTSPLYNGDQYLDMILCLGHGDVDVTEVVCGDSNVNTLEPGVVQYRVFKPAEHQSRMGVISAAMGADFHENVVTSPEVSDQEFTDANEIAGWYAGSKVGQNFSKVQFDIVFPGGITNPTDGGNLKGRMGSFEIQFQEIDDLDNGIGVVTVRRIIWGTDSGKLITWSHENTEITNSNNEKNKTAISSSLRKTYRLTMPKSGRYRFRIRRISQAPNANNGADMFQWVGLKAIIDNTTTKVYGNVTLMAVRIRASKGLGTSASARIRVRTTRRLPLPDGSGGLQPTNSPIDAFADIYTNAIYGANRPVNELDIAKLMYYRNRWQGYEFHYVFTGTTTVWEALKTALTPFSGEPLPVGQKMSIAEDGIKETRTALFTDANIIAGSTVIGLSFDEEGAADGIEIEYVDPKDWRQEYTVYPTTALRPDRYVLPGCANKAHADEYARLQWQRRQLQRKKVTFDTELEGLILQLGDRIGVASTFMNWGDSGLIVAVNGNRLQADHNLNWAGGPKYAIFRKTDGSPTDQLLVTRGASDHEMVLASALGGIHVDDIYEFTSFTFGEALKYVKDFTVMVVTPNDGRTVTVEAMNYAPTMFDNCMPYLKRT